MPIALISTFSPTCERSVGVLPAYARPLKHCRFSSLPVIGGGSSWANRQYPRSGGGAPLGRTMTAPNRPRNVFSVWFGPWSWYGQTPTDSGTHSHWYVNV